MPEPLASCPVIKAGSYPVLAEKRAKWQELTLNYFEFKANMLDPVYAEYVENVPADYYSPCHQRAKDAKASGDGWVARWDAYFLGTPITADSGTFGNTKKLIDDLDCDKPQAEWMDHAANIAAALDNLDAQLQTAWYELIGLQSVFNMVYQDCPVPRPAG